MTRQEFLAWEQASRDTIDVKRCYVDLADGDLVAGILLSQVIYWHLPAKNGDDKLVVERDGEKWLAKGRADWWDECRITPKQFDRACAILESQGIIETDLKRFNGSPTKHIRVCWEVFLRELTLLSMRVRGGASDTHEKGKEEEKMDFTQRSKSKFPKGRNPSAAKGKVEIDERGKSLTETTAQTTAQTTTQNPPPPGVPPASSAPEEEDADVKAVHEKQQECVDKMIAQITSITKTSIEIKALQPLALECARREHKDAWKHTLGVMKIKMACDPKPTMPNRYAAKVLAEALESPALPAKAVPPQGPPVQSVEAPDDEKSIEAYLDTLVPEDVVALYAQAEEATRKDLRKKRGCVGTNFAKIVAKEMVECARPMTL